MTKTSKHLTIVVTVFSIVFMGITAVMSTVRTDWKARATKEFPKDRIAAQMTQLQDLEKEIADLKLRQESAAKNIAADVQAIVAEQVGREAQLQTELAQLIEEAHTLAEQIEVEGKKVQLKQEEDKRLREEVTRLKEQYDDLVAQRSEAIDTVKRQRDLLFQAKGILERVTRRMESLRAEQGKSGEYEETQPARGAAASRTTKAFK
jgi:chromosome segregation ATPase